MGTGWNPRVPSSQRQSDPSRAWTSGLWAGWSPASSNKEAVFLCTRCTFEESKESDDGRKERNRFCYLFSSQFTVGSSILLIRTTKCLTPAVLANMACSLVCPPFSKPVSNSPLRAEITWKVVAHLWSQKLHAFFFSYWLKFLLRSPYPKEQKTLKINSATTCPAETAMTPIMFWWI